MRLTMKIQPTQYIRNYYSYLQMSYQQENKKYNELESLEFFLEAYEFTTNEVLTVVEQEENPDFLCENCSGEIIGIELTKIMRDPRDAFMDSVLDRKEEMDVEEFTESIYYEIERKEQARKKRYQKNAEKVVLVLEVVDGALGSCNHYLDSLKGDFTFHGFHEIWLADFSDREAYGDIELFGIHPTDWWGYKQRYNPGRKPYG